MTHGLCSIHDNFTTLGSTINQKQVVSLSNPANVEYEVVHTTLSPGLLKTLQHNCSENFTTGMKYFEMSNVVLADNTHVIMDTIVGSKNVRRVSEKHRLKTEFWEQWCYLSLQVQLMEIKF